MDMEDQDKDKNTLPLEAEEEGTAPPSIADIPFFGQPGIAKLSIKKAAPESERKLNIPATHSVPPPSPLPPMQEEAPIKANYKEQFKQEERKSRGFLARIAQLFLVFSLFIFLIAVAIYAVPLLMDWEKQKQYIITEVKNITGRDLTIQGQIQLQLLPSPRFEIRGLKLANAPGGASPFMLEADSVQAIPSLLPLMFGKISVKSLTFANATLNLEHLTGQEPNWSMPLKADDLARHTVDVLNFRQSSVRIISGSSDVNIAQTIAINDAAVAVDSLKGPYTVNGSFGFGGPPVKVAFHSDNLSSLLPVRFNLNIATESAVLTWEGKVANWPNNPKLDGSLTGKVDRSIIPVLNMAGIGQTPFSKTLLSLVMGAPTELDADFSYGDKMLEAKDIGIKSEGTEGKIDLKADFNETAKIQLDLAFETLNLDALQMNDGGFKNTALSKSLKLNEEAPPLITVFGDTDMEVKLNIKQANFRKVTVSDIQANAEIKNNIGRIRDLSIKGLPGNADISMLSGEEQGDTVSRLQAKGDDLRALLTWLLPNLPKPSQEKMQSFALTSQLEFAGSLLNIKELKMNAGDIQISGEASISQGVEPALTASLKTNQLNLDDYFTFPAESEWLDQFFSKAPTQQEILDYQQYFNDLRARESYWKKMNITLDVAQISAQALLYKDVHAVFGVEDNHFALNDLSFASDRFGMVKADIKLDVEEATPKLEASIAVDHFDSASLAETAQKKDSGQKPYYSETPFFLNRLGVISSKADIRCKECVLGRLNTKNLITTLTVDKEVLSIPAFKAQVFDGIIELRAALGVPRPALSFSYTLTNAKIDDVFKDLLGVDIFTAGRISASGNGATTGANVKAMVQTMEGQGSFTARGITVKGFNLNELAQTLGKYSEIDQVRKFGDYVLATGDTTFDYLSNTYRLFRGGITFEKLAPTYYFLEASAINGLINLMDWTVNLQGAMQVKIGVGETASGVIPLTFSVSGNLPSPSGQWDKTGIQNYWEQKFYKTR